MPRIHSHVPAGGPPGLGPGQVRPRPRNGHSQIHSGVHALSPLVHGTQRFQPLPEPLGHPPYHYDLTEAIPDIAEKAAHAGKIVFHAVGDTGGIKNSDYQSEVATLMKGDLNKRYGNAPSFFYHLGDVVYYNGELSDYYAQFYEPYNNYHAPIFSIPGNHDGDPVDASQTSLDGWVAYFMQAEPHIDPASHDAPRTTMSQPNVYFTLNCPFVTIVGMYTNVPEHGSIDSVQQQWLTHEFATAPKDKALLVALHHPIYSFDDHHSGSPRMADALQHAINDSRRVPNMVLTAHVHNYQRIERAMAGGGPTPFLVAGHGGYFHLHHLNAEVGAVDSEPGAEVKLVSANDTNHGYLTLTVDKEAISGVMSTIDARKAAADPAADTFSYPAKAVFLPEGGKVSL